MSSIFLKALARITYLPSHFFFSLDAQQCEAGGDVLPPLSKTSTCIEFLPRVSGRFFGVRIGTYQLSGVLIFFILFYFFLVVEGRRGKKEREEKFGLRLRFVIYDLYADGISFPVEVSWLGRSNFFFLSHRLQRLLAILVQTWVEYRSTSD